MHTAAARPENAPVGSGPWGERGNRSPVVRPGRVPFAAIKERAAKHPKLTRIGWQPDSPQADADSATKLTAEDVYARLCRLGLRHPAPVSAQGVEVKTRAARFRTLAGLATP